MEQGSQTALPYSGGNTNISRHFEEDGDGSYYLRNFVFNGQSIQFKVRITFEKCFFEGNHMPDCTYQISSHANDFFDNKVDKQKATNFLSIRHPVQTIKQTQDLRKGSDPVAEKQDVPDFNKPETVVTDFEKPTELDVKQTETDIKPVQPHVRPTEPDVKITEPDVKITEPDVQPLEPDVDILADPDTPSVVTEDPVNEYTKALVSDGLRVNWLNMMCNLSPLISKSVPETTMSSSISPQSLTFSEPSEFSRSTDTEEFSDDESAEPDNIDAFVTKMAHFEDLPQSPPPPKIISADKKRQFDVSINMNALLTPLTPLTPTIKKTSLSSHENITPLPKNVQHPLQSPCDSEDNKDFVKLKATKPSARANHSNKPALTPIVPDYLPGDTTAGNANKPSINKDALRRSSAHVDTRTSKDKVPKRRKSSIRKFMDKVQNKFSVNKSQNDEPNRELTTITKSTQKDSRPSKKAPHNAKPPISSKPAANTESDEDFDKSAAEAIYSPKPLRHVIRPKRQSLGNLYSPSLTSLNEMGADKYGVKKFVPTAPPRRRRHTEISKRNMNQFNFTQHESTLDYRTSDRPSSVGPSRRVIEQSDLPERPASVQPTRRRGVCMQHETGFDVQTKVPSEQDLGRSTTNTVYRTYSEQSGKARHPTFSRSFGYNYRTPSETDLMHDGIMEHETTLSRSTKNINEDPDDLTHLLSNYQGSLGDLSHLITSQNFEDNSDLFSQSNSSINSSMTSLLSPVFAGFPSQEFGERVLTSMNSSPARRRVTTSAYDLRYTQHQSPGNFSERSGLMEYETTLDQYNSGTSRMRKPRSRRASSMVNISSRIMQYETTLDRSNSHVGKMGPKSSGSMVNLIERETSFDGKHPSTRTKSMADLRSNKNNFMQYETTLDRSTSNVGKIGPKSSGRTKSMADLRLNKNNFMQYETTLDRSTSNVGKIGLKSPGRQHNTRAKSMADLSLNENSFNRIVNDSMEWVQLQRMDTMEHETTFDRNSSQKRGPSRSTNDLRSSKSFQDFELSFEDSIPMQHETTLDMVNFNTKNIARRSLESFSTDSLTGNLRQTDFERSAFEKQRVEAMEHETSTTSDVGDNRKRAVSTSACDVRSSTRSSQEFDVPPARFRYADEKSRTLELERDKPVYERKRRQRATSMVNIIHSEQYYETALDRTRSLADLIEKTTLNLEETIEPIEGMELLDRMQYESKI